MDRPSQTSLSLLDGMRVRDPRQWERFVKLYSPLVYEWCRRAGINESDSADVVQNVFRSVSGRISDFRKERSTDTFQGWLWTITRNATMDHFRRLARQPAGIGGSTANLRIHQTPDIIPTDWGEESTQADQQSVYRRALELIESEFETHTWRAFWRTTIAGTAAKDVAQELDMTPGSVYNARYKVLKRLREEFVGLVDVESQLGS